MDNTKRFIKETNGVRYLVNEKGEALPCPVSAPITRITKSLSASGQSVEFDRMPCSESCPLFNITINSENNSFVDLCHNVTYKVDVWK